MKKRPRFIAFSTQKGGVGKTTFTVLAASYLHYARDYNVLLVDCDYPQHSIQQMRKRDSEMLDRSQTLHEMAIELFSRIEKPTFKILCAKPEECVDDALRFIEDSDDEFDFVFFDLAGTFNNDGIIRALAQVDYIFTPIAADEVSLASTISFATVIKEHIVDAVDTNIKQIYLFWNQVDGRERTNLYEQYERVIKSIGVPMMQTTIPSKIRFKRELSLDSNTVFRSTIFPPSRSLLKGTNFEELIGEIIELTNDYDNEERV
ncbi:MAG: ParA family protein [Rikenellaceae bacterium]